MNASWRKISKDLIPDNALQSVKKMKLQEEKAKQNYESEKAKAEGSKKDIQDVAELSTDPEELRKILKGLSSDPSLLSGYFGVGYVPIGWKVFVVQKILQNHGTPPEALLEYWNFQLKHELKGSGHLSGEGFGGAKTTLELSKSLFLNHNCPPVVFEDFAAILPAHQSWAPYFKDIVFSLTDSHLLSSNALENLSKVKMYQQIPSIMENIAVHPNAPLNATINYVLSNPENNLSRLNEIKNTKAMEYIAKLNHTILGFPPKAIERLVNDRSTSTDVLKIIANLRKEVEHVYGKKKEALNSKMSQPVHQLGWKTTMVSGEIMLEEDSSEIEPEEGGGETIGEFLDRIEAEIGIHPNMTANNDDARKNAILDYYSKYAEKNNILDKRIVEMLREFRGDFVMDALRVDLEEKLSTEAPSTATANLSTATHLKAFWDNLVNANKKIYFATIDTNADNNFLVGSQTLKDYLNSKYWNIEANVLSMEEAGKIAKELASEDPNGILCLNVFN